MPENDDGDGWCVFNYLFSLSSTKPKPTNQATTTATTNRSDRCTANQEYRGSDFSGVPLKHTPSF